MASMVREAIKYEYQISRVLIELEGEKNNLSFMNFCFILPRVIQNLVLHLQWSFFGNS